MKNKIAFIGGGNMGRAIMTGLIKKSFFAPQDMYVYDVNGTVRESLSSELGVTAANSASEAVSEANIVLLAVKPQVLPAALEGIRESIGAEKLVISIAAGITLAKLESLLGGEHRIVRVMPNTPALVGEGMAGICANANATEADRQLAVDMFSCLGKAQAVGEHIMDSVVGLSGSGPAYVYMFIEALADGAVQEGMPRAQAYVFAAQTVLGSAKMVLESGKHPGELKDMVCSPAGTTIEAVRALEESGFRAAVMNAVIAAAEKNKDMAK